jgi:hypothetical protein
MEPRLAQFTCPLGMSNAVIGYRQIDIVAKATAVRTSRVLDHGDWQCRGWVIGCQNVEPLQMQFNRPLRFLP